MIFAWLPAPPGRRLVWWIFCLLLLPLLAADAQSLRYDVMRRPASAEYWIFRTEHFDIVYPRGSGGWAREMANVLETNLPETRRLIKQRRSFRMPVVLHGYSDASNGYVNPFPFKQEIELTPLRSASLSPRSWSWLETVGTHELTHGVQAEAGDGFGVGSVMRFFAPDWARAFNFLLPAGITEGVAVYQESRIRPQAGRLHHPYFSMQFRAAASAEKPWSLTQMLEPPAYHAPGDRYYIGGAHLVKYLAAQDSLAFFHRSLDLNYRIPFLGYGVGLWHGAKSKPRDVYSRFKQAVADQSALFVQQLGPLTQATPVAGAPGMRIQRPRWIDDRTLVALAQGYHMTRGIYRYDVDSGEQSLISPQTVTEDGSISLSADGRHVYLARYSPDTWLNGLSTAEAYRVDRLNGEEAQLTYNGRVLAPVEFPDGRIWALQNDGPYNHVVEILGDGSTRRLSRYERALFLEIAPSPQGDGVLALVHVQGRQGLFDLTLDAEGQAVLTPRLIFENSSIYDVSWSRGGQYVLFTSDLNGVLNVYAMTVTDGSVYQVTNVPYAALQPALSPSGHRLAFVEYQHEQFRLMQMPFSLDAANRIEDHSVQWGLRQKWEEWLSEPPLPAPSASFERPYKSLRHARPRAIMPHLTFDTGAEDSDDTELGFGGGITIEGADPLQTFAYRGQAFGQAGQWWGSVHFQTSNNILRPELRVYNEPEVLNAPLLTQSGVAVDTVRIGRQSRGGSLGISVPMMLANNAYQSGLRIAFRGVWEQQRFFDADEGPQTSFAAELALRPTLSFYHRLQRNRRDIVPNAGVVFSATGEWDVYREAGPDDRAVLARLQAYWPWLKSKSIGVRTEAGVLVQNQGGVYSLTSFLPRGFDEVFAGEGIFLKYGLEVTTPIAYIDDGILLPPIFVHAVYAYVFGDGWKPFGAASDQPHLISAGVGLGIQFRLLHVLPFDLKVGWASRVSESGGEFVFR